MAVFKYISDIKESPYGSIRYIQDEQKCIANSDTMNAMSYMQDHAVEELMSVGYNGCSGICAVAAEQFKMSQAKYRESHGAYKAQSNTYSVAQYLESNKKKWLPKAVKEKVIAPSDAESMMPLDDAIRIWNNKDNPDEQREAARKVMEAYTLVTKKTENIAAHFTVSLHRDDNPTPEQLQEIMDEFMAHPIFDGHLAITNRHFDKPHKHGHILVSNFKSNGASKLNLRGSDELVLMRHLDRICYKHGFSVIDCPAVRQDPEHSKWLDEVIAEGKVKVRKPSEYGSSASHLKDSKGKSQKKNQSWKAEKNRKVAASEAYLDNASDLNPFFREEFKDAARNDLFSGYQGFLTPVARTLTKDELYQLAEEAKRRRTKEEEEAVRRRRRAEEEQWRRYYYVRIYYYNRSTHRYQQRSFVSLLFELGKVIITGESNYMQTYYPSRYNDSEFSIQTNWKIQNMIDSMYIADELNVKTPVELDQRVQEVGSQIGERKRAIAECKKTLEKGERLATAIRTWRDKSLPEEERKQAYAIMAAHRTTKDEDIENFLWRYNRAANALPEQEERLKHLNKDYREVKKAQTTLNTLNYECQRYTMAARECSQFKPDLGVQVQKAAQTAAQKAPQRSVAKVTVPPSPAPADEAKKNTDWIREQRDNNKKRVNHTLDHAEKVLSEACRIRGESYSQANYQDLTRLIEQTAYLESALQTEKDKLNRLIEKWDAYNDLSLPIVVRQECARYIQWCGCNPEEPLELTQVQGELTLAEIQEQQVLSMREVLLGTSELWKGRNDIDEAEFTIAWAKQHKRQLKSQIRDIKKSRSHIWNITMKCHTEARKCVFNREKWDDYYNHLDEYSEKTREQQTLERRIEEAKQTQRNARKKIQEAKKEIRRTELEQKGAQSTTSNEDHDNR